MNIDSKISYLSYFIEKYDISFDVDTFNVESYEKPFTTTTFITFLDNWSFRLFAIDKRYEVDENEKLKPISYNRQLYHLQQRQIAKLKMSEIYEIREECIKFALFSEQIKLYREYQKIESMSENVADLAKISHLKTLKR